MSDDWYVRKGHKTLGPLPESQVRSVLETGRIAPDTPVRRGTSGPWIPAEQALSEAANQKTLTPSRTKTRIPIAIGALVGLVVVVGGLMVAFRMGRHRDQPAITAASADDDVKSDDDTSAKSTIEDPIPTEARTSIIATRPKANGGVGTVAGDHAPLKTQPLASPKNSTGQGASHTQPKPTERPQPKVSVAKMAPVIVPKAPATESDLRALEATAVRSPTAKDALALYETFGATRTIPRTLEDTFKANHQLWSDRATQDLVRLGDQWVSASDATRAHEEAAQLFQQAYEMTKNLSFEEARNALERASRVDPNSIAADFTLGILSSITPPKYRNPQAAAKHFQAVLQRFPGYVPALNNLAIAEIREEKYAEAVQHLREAADHTPTSEEVMQNLGRFTSEAQLGRIRPSEAVLSEATNLNSEVRRMRESTATEVKHGWRYMPLVSPKEERAGLSRVPAPEADSIAWIAQGTGVVVEPHYVLACRHVVDDIALGRADKIELIDPTDAAHQRRLPATCVDVSQEEDLCLLRCDALNAPPIALADKLPPRGSDVELIGFPGGSWGGLRLRTSRGTVTALPGDVPRIGGPNWVDFSHKLWSDATSTPGASGEALCDDHAHVVAIHSTDYRPGNDPAKVTYSGSVPAPIAAAFIRHSLPKFAHPPAGGLVLKWSDVEAKVSPSLVLIAVGYRKVALVMEGKPDTSPLTRAVRLATTDIYDDRVCSVCNGAVRIRCRAPGCPYSGLHDPTAANEATNAGAAKTTTSVKRMCPACLGTGYVRCPHCSIGIDPLLR
ncbi:MAG TPA: trypsin-like peptidase domain-containing protein [Planctomycetaceae bacterium]|nr:trypsin-like peptidase domain-containing protein [Planctomycetaceae bacterium]